MTEETTALPASETAGGAAEVQTPAPTPETPGAKGPVEEAQPEGATPEGQVPETPAETPAETPDAETPAEPTLTPELQQRQAEIERQEAELARRRQEAEQAELWGRIEREQDPAMRQQLMVQYEVQAIEQTRQHMDQFAREHGLDPMDERINRTAPDQGTFEASVLAAEVEDLRANEKDLTTRVATVENDIGRLVKQELAKQRAESGNGIDPGGGGGAAQPVKDWTTATPEQIADRRRRLHSRR